MKFNRNTRISFMISLFAIVAVITIICYLNFNHNKKNSNTSTVSNEIAFLSNTSQISASAINSQAYHGTLNISTQLDKNLNTYYISSENPAANPTVSVDDTNSQGIQNGMKYNTESASHINTAEYSKLIKQAVDDGARLIICPDSSYAETIYTIQNDYINTYFIIVDGTPHNADCSDQTINYNVIPISYNETEIGFFAGYALVYEGYTSLAFIGSNNGATHYGYGFLQGANLAAAECNIGNVDICYCYAENINNAKETADQYYSSGIPVIVTAGDNIIDALHDTALEYNTYLISCGNYDDSFENFSQLIGIAFKDISSSVSDTIYNFYSGDITGGKIIQYGTDKNGIGFSYDNEIFHKFDSDVYKDIYARLSEDNIKLISDTTVSTEDLGLTHITIK